MKNKKFLPLVILVGVVALLGILLAFYFRPQEVWTDGTHLWGRASKAPELLRQSLAGKINKKKEG